MHKNWTLEELTNAEMFSLDTVTQAHIAIAVNRLADVLNLALLDHTKEKEKTDAK